MVTINHHQQQRRALQQQQQQQLHKQLQITIHQLTWDNIVVHVDTTVDVYILRNIANEIIVSEQNKTRDDLIII